MKRIVSLLLVTVLLCAVFPVSSEGVDISGMTLAELRALEKAIEQEILENHTPAAGQASDALTYMREKAETYLAKKNILFSWTDRQAVCVRDWDLLTLTDTVLIDPAGAAKEKTVSAQVYLNGTGFRLFFLQVGDETFVDLRRLIPDPRLNSSLRSVYTETGTAAAPAATPKAKATAKPTATPKPKATAKPTATPKATAKPKNEYGPGDSVTQDNVTVKFIRQTQSNGSSYNKPESGMVFVLCEFSIENNTSEDLAISSLLSVSAYCDDYSVSPSFSAMLESPGSTLDGTVSPGRKLRGTVGFQVPKGWKKLEISINTGGLFWDTNIFDFVCRK